MKAIRSVVLRGSCWESLHYGVESFLAKANKAAVLLLVLSACIVSLASAQQWTQLQPYPSIRSGHAATVSRSYIYLFGGRSGGTNYNLAHRSHFISGSFGSSVWTPLANMNTTRYFAAAAPADTTVSGKVYVFGGYVNGSATPGMQVEEYDPVTNTWTFKAPMPVARARMQALQINGLIYVMGGVDATGTAMNLVQTYNPVTNTSATVAPMLTARADFGATNYAPVNYFDKHICVAGGRSNLGTTGLSSVETYNPFTNTWTAFPINLPAPIYGNSLSTPYWNFVISTGGYLSGGIPTAFAHEVTLEPNATWTIEPGYLLRPMAHHHTFQLWTQGFSLALLSIGGLTSGNVPVNNCEWELVTVVLSAASIELQATQTGTNVQVDWQQNPADVLSYQLERSQNGQQFGKLGSPIAAGAESAHHGRDPFPLNGKSYYRVSILYKSGETKTSEAVELDFERSGIVASISIGFALRYALPSGENEASFALIGMDGKLHRHFEREGNTGFFKLDVENLATGIYYLGISAGKQRRTLKVLVN